MKTGNQNSPVPYTPHYQAVLVAFGAYLQAVGYRNARTMTAQLAEFLHWLEDRKVYYLADVTREQLAHHVNYLTQRKSRLGKGLSPKSIHDHFYSIRLFFEWQEQEGRIKTNPASALKVPQPKAAPRLLLTKEEVKRMMEYAKTPLERAILALCYGCGLRRSEACSLQVADVGLASNCLYVKSGKFGKRRKVVFPVRIRQILAAYLQTRPAPAVAGERNFLLTPYGHPLPGGALNEYVKLMAERADLPEAVTPHVLRHCYATHLQAAGTSPEVIQKLMGHASLDTTIVYARAKKRRNKHLFPIG